MRTFKNKTMLKLTGFENFLEDLQEAGKRIDVEGRKCFEKAAENIYDELVAKAESAGLDNRLIEQISEEWDENGNANRWNYSVGWKKAHPKANPLPDTYKVMFYNYGTPRRTTKAGYNRGAESPHPKGSHGFIKKAKLAAANKNKKLYKDTLSKILEGLKK